MTLTFDRFTEAAHFASALANHHALTVNRTGSVYTFSRRGSVVCRRDSQTFKLTEN